MTSLSPRQLARAAGVSESSVKRWCDRGHIETVKTSGGHRRISLPDAAEFLRAAGTQVQPELLGLPAIKSVGPRNRGPAADGLQAALLSGDDDACARLLLDLHLAGESVSRMCDDVIAPALHCIGSGWEEGRVKIYQERRACGVCLRALEQLKAVIPPGKSHAPLAIGAAPECDPYMLPTAMAELVLRQAGWQSQSLGSRLTFATLLEAVRQMRPALFWLSVSHIDDEERFLQEYRLFHEQIQGEVAVVVGGRALTETLRRRMAYAAYGDNLQHLEAFARTLKRSLSGNRPRARRGPALSFQPTGARLSKQAGTRRQRQGGTK